MHVVVVVFALRWVFSPGQEFAGPLMTPFNGKVAESPKLVSEYQ